MKKRSGLDLSLYRFSKFSAPRCSKIQILQAFLELERQLPESDACIQLEMFNLQPDSTDVDWRMLKCFFETFGPQEWRACHPCPRRV
jgi:hypothetical protein